MSLRNLMASKYPALKDANTPSSPIITPTPPTQSMFSNKYLIPVVLLTIIFIVLSLPCTYKFVSNILSKIGIRNLVDLDGVDSAVSIKLIVFQGIIFAGCTYIVLSRTS